MLSEGDSAPDFDLPCARGGNIRLSELRDYFIVLYFYPKDDTAGCTKEAINFTELKSEFEELDAKIIGVSPDTIKSHAKFLEKHALGIILLSDSEKSSIEAYGVWAEKMMYGKSYMGVVRSTFLIAPNGKILQVWRNVKIPGHAASVLEALKEHRQRMKLSQNL